MDGATYILLHETRAYCGGFALSTARLTTFLNWLVRLKVLTSQVSVEFFFAGEPLYVPANDCKERTKAGARMHYWKPLNQYLE
ncbi:MAG TPA: hypothetical protein VFC07_05110 [Verrucomicrobiae bacterium]|nr:hypothetical protein [Verrucomicrobiae bacterium]